MEDRIYYVYEYFSDCGGMVQLDDKEFKVKKGQVYYVGKGHGKRVSTGIRNNWCEKFKKEVGWNHRIVIDNLSEEEALQHEEELIKRYKSEGLFLTNKVNGNSSIINSETIATIKYLVLLNRARCIKMTTDQMVLETESYGGIVCEINNLDFSDKGHRYFHIPPKCPDNIEYILNEYDSITYTDREVKIGNIKYILNLHDNGLIKGTQKDIANYFDESDTTISYIKKEKVNKEIPPIKPINLIDILKDFDTGAINETEYREGVVKYIIDKLIETNILNMTIRDLVRELKNDFNVTESWIHDLKRRKETVRYIKPDDGILLGRLFHKYHEISY